MANPKVVKSSINFGIESGTTNVLFATWQYSTKLAQTDNYEIRWWYKTRNSEIQYFLGTETTADTYIRQSKYTIPDNAVGIKFQIKPVAKNHTVNNKEQPWYKGDWTTAYWAVPSAIIHTPATPSAPDVTVNGYSLTAEVEVYDANSKWIEFGVIKNDSTRVQTGFIKVTTNKASYSCGIDPGNSYKVHCRAYYYTRSEPIRANVLIANSDELITSEWSEYSESVISIPKIPKISKVKALSDTSIQIHWSSVLSATEYEVEYATSAGYFDSAPSEVQSVTVQDVLHAELTGLESGRRWVFRLRAINSAGESGWSKIGELVIGKAPSAPTTWAESTTVVIPNMARMFWTHNTVDGSDQTAAQLEMTINGTTTTENFTTATSYGLSTSEYAEGASISWRVRTKGAFDAWSPWSTLRTITLYSEPGLELDCPTTIESFPISISALATPASQLAIGYDISIVSDSTYYDIDYDGRRILIARGQQIFQKYYNAGGENSITRDISAFEANLQNGQSYTLTMKVAMSSGLTAEASESFIVEYDETDMIINAEIAIDESDYSAYIRPYAETEEDGIRPGDLLLSVYRRDYDGNFTLIAENIPNTGTTVTDLHPSLDYARYRIVTINQNTGDVDYSDIPSLPINATCIVIQWDEDWYSFDTDEASEFEEPVISGSMLILPANVDISDSYNQEVALVNYIGRNHPVSYYGTQKGVTSTWNCDIDIRDSETLFQLRRLAMYAGNAYVREPSGAGYLARVTVSFSKKHKETTIPVTLGITRVDGSE